MGNWWKYLLDVLLISLKMISIDNLFLDVERFGGEMYVKIIVISSL